jgi:DNA polymerase-3 subunit beta
VSLTVPNKDLAAAVSHVMRAIPSRPRVPEFGHIRLAVEDDDLMLTGFNGETLTARARVPILRGSLPLSLLPHGATLADFVSALPGDVTLEEQGASLGVRSGRVRYAVPVIDPSNYPRTPAMPPAVGTSVGFSEALSYVLSSAATAGEVIDANAALGSIHMDAADGLLTLLATDGYRVSRASVPWDGRDFTANALAKTLGEFARSMAGSMLTLHADENLLGLSAGALTVVTTLIAQEFPVRATNMIDAARQAALSDDGGVLIIAKPALLEALKAMSKAIDRNGGVWLHLNAEGETRLEGNGRTTTEIATVKQGSYDLSEAFYDGPDHSVKIQPHLLESVIVGTPHPFITLGVLTTALKPIHVGGQVEDDSEDIEPAVQHIVMPLREIT